MSIETRLTPFNSRKDQRAIVGYLYAKGGKTGAAIQRELQQTIRGKPFNQTSVNNWIKKIKAGRTTSDDMKRSGRAQTATTVAQIAVVKALIKQDRHISIRALKNTAGISYGSVWNILKKLHLRECFSRWMPKELNQNQKNTRVRICTENIAFMKRIGVEKFFERFVTGLLQVCLRFISGLLRSTRLGYHTIYQRHVHNWKSGVEHVKHQPKLPFRSNIKRKSCARCFGINEDR